MCDDCGFVELAARIEVHLERRIPDHVGKVLEHISNLILSNEHVERDQADAIEAVLERGEAS